MEAGDMEKLSLKNLNGIIRNGKYKISGGSVNFYFIKLRPLTPFGTLPKGDTIFGRLCWEIVYRYGDNKLKDLLNDYAKNPFMVTSSLYPFKDDKIYLKTPSLQLDKLFTEEERQNKDNIKEMKKKKYIELSINDNIFLNTKNPKYTLEEIAKHKKIVIKEYRYTHNTINRLTFTTGKGDDMFSPFDEIYIYYSSELGMFIALDETKLRITEVVEILNSAGKTGFGKDSSIGLGKFEIAENPKNIKFENRNTNLFYALSPFIPKKEDKNKIGISFTPFIRYGKHGDPISKSNKGLKKAIIMCDEGSVIEKKDENVIKENIYGIGITGISEVKTETVSQGYTICLPLI